MVRKIDRDANRFKQIVRGKIKSDLRKYITHGEMIGKTGGEFVSIPLPQIEIPEFRYGAKNRGGVGQGPGDVGTPIGRSGDGEAGQGAGEAPGHHILEVELTLDDLAADPRRGARPAPDRAQGAGQHHRGEGQVHRHPPGRARRASATSSGPTRRRSSGRSPRTRTTPATPWSSRSARTSSTARGTRSRCPSPTPWSST